MEADLCVGPGSDRGDRCDQLVDLHCVSSVAGVYQGIAEVKILGIDPGYATTGFGLITSDRAQYGLLQYGVITTPPSLSFPQRLEMLYEDMCRLIEVTKPDAVAVEELFWGHNITTGIGVSHGRGVILLAIQKAGLPIYEYTPMQVKQSVVGYGKAEKRQVMDMTRRLLKMEKLPRPDDAADAIAIALCHARSATSLLNRG